jgi:hypothetical protein
LRPTHVIGHDQDNGRLLREHTDGGKQQRKKKAWFHRKMTPFNDRTILDHPNDAPADKKSHVELICHRHGGSGLPVQPLVL